jgi:K+-transporting ATPase KdpF subunit
MTWSELFSLFVAGGMAVYLVVALLFPERF